MVSKVRLYKSILDAFRRLFHINYYGLSLRFYGHMDLRCRQGSQGNPSRSHGCHLWNYDAVSLPICNTSRSMLSYILLDGWMLRQLRGL
jgi:hypothetical protein